MSLLSSIVFFYAMTVLIVGHIAGFWALSPAWAKEGVTAQTGIEASSPEHSATTDSKEQRDSALATDAVAPSVEAAAVNADNSHEGLVNNAEPHQSTAAPAQASAPAQGNKVQLFGTVEFKRPLSSLPAWLDLLKRNGQSSIFEPAKVFKRDVTWSSFKSKAPKAFMERLRYVNAFWNTWPYKEDIVNWHKQDYWAIPDEFLKKSGDCEDYSIVKYFTLKELGVPPENMRIVVVRDTVRNFAHAVLAVYDNGDAYILDNLSNAVLSHSRLRQYMPQYSVNEFCRWAHLKGRKIK